MQIVLGSEAVCNCFITFALLGLHIPPCYGLVYTGLGIRTRGRIRLKKTLMGVVPDYWFFY